MSFEAKYAGTCCLCEERICVGDMITYALDDVVVHEDCDSAVPVERKAEVCGKCWLTMPCDCDQP